MKVINGDLMCIDMRKRDGSIRRATRRTKGAIVGRAITRCGECVGLTFDINTPAIHPGSNVETAYCLKSKIS